MADTNAVSLSGAQVFATSAEASLANSVMHLFQQGFIPTPANVVADFVAQECDFDNYSPATITSWATPVLAGSGWGTYAPTQTFRWAHVSADVGNSVGGHWIEDSSGNLIGYAIYDPVIPCQGPGQAVIKTPSLVFPAG